LRRLSLFSAAVLSAAILIPGLSHAQSGTIVAAADPVPSKSVNSNQTLKQTPIKLDKPFKTWAIGAKASTLGFGVEAATPLTWRTNLRVGYNYLNYSPSGLDITQDELTLNSAKLALRSATANVDLFVLGPMHISPGLLFYNTNQITAVASPAAGSVFTFNGTSYVVNVPNQLTGTAKLDLGGVAPELLIGFGNMVPRGHHNLSFHFEFGAVYQGTPKVALNLAGQVCTPLFNGSTVTGSNCQDVASNPTVQANIKAEQDNFNNNKTLKYFKYYPVVSFGLSYKL
jgi:hypothetical protein